MAYKVKVLPKKERIGLSSFEKFRNNPFVEKAIEDISVVKKRQFISPTKNAEVHAIVDKTGEAVGHTAFMKYIEVDEAKFTKLYLSQFEAFWDLPKSAMKVFGYIMNQMKPADSKFEFFYDECKKHKSKQPIYDGLTALIQNGIIARGYNENTFFVNPLIAFNGSRVTFARTYVKKKKEADPNQTQLPLDNLPEKQPSALDKANGDFD